MKRAMIMTCAAAAVLTLAGCRSEAVISDDLETGKVELTEAQITETESETEQSEGQLVMAIAEEGPPYAYRDDDELTGIAVETAQAVAEAMNMELVIEEMPADAFRSALLAERCDLVVGGNDIAEAEAESDEAVYRSEDFAVDHPVLVVREGSGINTAEELRNEVVGIQLNSRGESLVSKYYVEDLRRYEQASRAVDALKEEQIDALVIDLEQAQQLIRETDGLVVYEEAYGQTYYGFQALRENQELCSRLAEALKEADRAGTIDEIAGKYVNAE